ncbi:MAG: hypothetical protein LUQ27_01040, partial [Methanomassiliicoccales archaeon]|nr:hypothetical protein [Methanomassiliicoccales archaeon]
MRILYIHADFMEYEVKKPTSMAEDIGEDMKSGHLEEVLVAFIAVEEQDENKVEQVAEEATSDIRETADKVGAARILLYPYAHLSSELSDPETGKKTLRRMEEILLDSGAQVKRAPFGWYKAFRISCKGHPLSELSREIVGEEKAPPPAGEEKYLILTQDGQEIAPEEFDGGSDCFRVMMEKEAL